MYYKLKIWKVVEGKPQIVSEKDFFDYTEALNEQLKADQDESVFFEKLYYIN